MWIWSGLLRRLVLITLGLLCLLILHAGRLHRRLILRLGGLLRRLVKLIRSHGFHLVYLWHTDFATAVLAKSLIGFYFAETFRTIHKLLSSLKNAYRAQIICALEL